MREVVVALDPPARRFAARGVRPHALLYRSSDRLRERFCRRLREGSSRCFGELSVCSDDRDASRERLERRFIERARR